MLLIFAGHPESVLHVVFVGAVYGAFELLQTRAWKSIALAALAGILALALTAIFLLPFFDAVPQTVEHHVRMTRRAAERIMRLADFITQNTEPILAEWETFARRIWPRAPVGRTAATSGTWPTSMGPPESARPNMPKRP